LSRVTHVVNVKPTSTQANSLTLSAACKPGQHVTGGGFELYDADAHVTQSGPVTLLGSRGQWEEWEVRVERSPGTKAYWSFTVAAVCADG
ncbi:MAG: hypothetical protein M3389_00255, partial [Actinomycetota bacterium]|nr:hypothetical protein [Actinomycetota bacterium]